ncbi:Nephrin-like 26 [Homarus americanus]|uniref:Nephrin-like 26 n=1 Tax=Homarus americanus TaxID=6706 RepID=A0A8J5N1S6_HOMAM|nr:Nephrin-like 26 [Homarus americanus]
MMIYKEVLGYDVQECVFSYPLGKEWWVVCLFTVGDTALGSSEYAGDASQGEHHLVIKGITLEDDGEYQCQVGPTQSSLPIWSAANVTVMVSPSSIAMIGRSEGEMVEVKAASSLVLECIVSDSRPPPTITWYNNKKRIEPKHQTDAIKPSKKRRLMTVVSRLELTAQQEDDGVEYSCRAKHPALRNTANPLTASVTLSVLRQFR